jgi:hypothetical protein
MMKSYTRVIALCAAMFLCSCGHSFEPLKHSDLERWVRAYENIASVSPNLLDQKRVSRAGTLLACPACRSILEDQVIKAGYPNLQAFLVIDTRIRVAEVDFLHRQMTKALDSLDHAVQADAKGSCAPKGSSDPNQRMVEHSITLVCWVLAKKVEQMKKSSEIEDAVISKMTIESDVVFISANYATLDRTLSDTRLIEDYRNDLLPEEKGSLDPQRVRACNRLKLGLGDKQDKSKCPEIITPHRSVTSVCGSSQTNS